MVTMFQRIKATAQVWGNKENEIQMRYGPYFVFRISGKAKDEKRQWRHSFFSFRIQWEIRKKENEPYFVFFLRAEWEKRSKVLFFVFLIPGRNEKNELTVHTRTVNPTIFRVGLLDDMFIGPE